MSLSRTIFMLIVCLYLLHSTSSVVSADTLAYSVNIAGVEDPIIKKRLETQSLLLRLVDKPPKTMAALNRRISNDMRSLQNTLQEFGYYDAHISDSIINANGKKTVILTIATGDLYTISDFTVHWSKPLSPTLMAKFGSLPIGQSALPETILQAEKAIINMLMQNGYPFPTLSDRKLYVYHDRQAIAITMEADPGPQLMFGTTTIEGLTTLQPAFVERRIDWHEGQLFDVSRVMKTRKNLTSTGVIGGADVTYGDITTPSDQLPMILTLQERKHRSVGAGVAYSTSRDLIGNLFWEHRNLFGQAEHLKFRAEGGTQTRVLGVDFNKPDLWNNIRLNWQNTAELSDESVEAFDKRAIALGTIIDYQYSSRSTFSGGVALERSQIKEASESKEESFTLVSLPLAYRYDGSDDFLNPTKGSRFAISLVPYQVLNETYTFVKTDVTASHYLPLGDRLVWANRTRVAIIAAKALDEIPADKRLYAGGGGSVRGYGYQLLGPLDADNNPTGGRSAFELGTEGRYKFTETIEGVVFLEGGQVGQTMNVLNDTDLLWGAGVGVRYHTAIGPLRFDVAVPLDKRKVDDPFQLYISIGQAF